MDNTQDYKLAYELAATLNDRESVTAYLMFVERYKEEFLRKILAKVMAMPDHKIKRTRGALFTFLVNQHGHGHSRN